jgi:hypothetical protein
MNTKETATRAGLKPSQFAALIGHDVDFVYQLIDRGEITARNESLGNKQRRWRIDPDEAARWQERRVFNPRRLERQSPVLMPRVSGLLARMREAKRNRRAS